MHLDEYRKGQVLVDCSKIDFSEFTDADYGALAFHVGKVVGNEIPVFDGLPTKMNLEDLRFLASPLHVSGAVPMFHIPGITPEAPTLKVAFGGAKPEKVQVDMEDVKATYDEIATTGEDKLDMVNFGCPHLTYKEIREIAEFLDGKKVHKDVKLWVGTSYQVKVVADRAGWTQKIETAGALLVTNICMGPGAPLSETYPSIGYSLMVFGSCFIGEHLPLRHEPLRSGRRFASPPNWRRWKIDRWLNAGF